MPPEDTVTYEEIEFFHKICGLPDPPPEQELVSKDDYFRDVVQGVANALGVTPF